MSSFNCCFLTCIRISQEAGQVVWYSHLLKNFPQFVMIHSVKGFSIANEAAIDVFLEFPCFFYDPVDVGNLISDSSAFLNPALTSGSSRFTYYWNLAWRILSITFLACEMRATVRYFEHLFGISLLWDWNENWSFPVLLPLLSFPYFLAYWHLLGNTIQPINSDYCPHSRASCRAPSATWKSQHKSVPGIENWELWQ